MCSELTVVFKNKCLQILCACLFCLLSFVKVHSKCLEQADLFYHQGQEYMSRKQFLLATQQFSIASLLACSKQTQDQSRFNWGRSLFELGETEEALEVLKKIPKVSEVHLKSNLLKVWYQPELMTVLSPKDRSRYTTLQSSIAKLPNVSSPVMSALFSAVLPGSGQIYNGHLQSGVLSFLINAMFLSAAIELSKNDLHSSAVAAGAVFSVVYFGNIASAVKAAKAKNLRAKTTEIERLKGTHFPELFSYQ